MTGTRQERNHDEMLARVRWLEASSEAVTAWDREQNAATDRALEAWEDRAALRRYYEDALAIEAGGGKGQRSYHGPFQFFLRRPAGRQQPALYVEGAEGERLLADPTETNPEACLDWFHPSPDGTFVTYGISYGGDEQSVLYVVKTSTGDDLGIRVPHTSFAQVAWLPDESGFYYGGGRASDHVDAEKRLHFLSLDKGTPDAAEPLELNDPYVSPQLSEDGRYLVVNVSWEKPCAAYYRDLDGDGRWEPFLRDLDGESFGRFVGHDFYALLTTPEAPHGHVVSIPMDRPSDQSSWTEVVPQSEVVLCSVDAVAGTLVLTELHEGTSQIRLVPLDGASQATIRLPGLGLISPPAGNESSPFTIVGTSAYFTYTRFDHPPRLLRLDVDSATVEAVAADESGGTAPDLVVRQGTCRSRDGTEVPYFLVHRSDLERDEAHPALVYGYGGWNMPAGPSWIGPGGSGIMPFVEAGGIYVSAMLRGGCEFGREWWQAGRREVKQNTFDDLYAVAEQLIADGITTSGELAVHGRSNGGLLTAVAATQCPELFAAVVSEVPLTDMLRALDHPYLASYRIEYGDPHDPAFEPVLRAYSPVHNVREGVEYPATLILSAASDLRCQPWNGRKFASLLQEATAGTAPVVLRIAPGGHGGDLTIDQWIDRRTDVVGFIMQQLGMRMPEHTEPTRQVFEGEVT